MVGSMTVVEPASGNRAALRAGLLSGCERAVRRARRSGREVLLAHTVRVGPEVDPSAVAFATRVDGEPWSCFEQPERDGAALATVGCIRRLEARGPRRFAEVAASWRQLATGAEADAPDGP